MDDTQLRNVQVEAEQPGFLAHTLSRRRLLRGMVATVGVVAAGALLAACGDDDDDDDDGADATNTTSTGGGAATTSSGGATATTGGAAATTAGGSGTSSTGSGGGATHNVSMIADIAFDPAEMTLKVGDTVTWTVVGAIPHSSTCDPAKAADPSHAVLPEGADPWDSGILQEGQEFSHTFEVAGEYTYFCIPHESMNMIGKLTVEA